MLSDQLDGHTATEQTQLQTEIYNRPSLTMLLALALPGLGFGGGVIRLYGVCLRVVWLCRHIRKQIDEQKVGYRSDWLWMQTSSDWEATNPVKVFLLTMGSSWLGLPCPGFYICKVRFR